MNQSTWKKNFSAYRGIMAHAWESCPNICGEDDAHMDRAHDHEAQYLIDHPELLDAVALWDTSECFQRTGYEPENEAYHETSHELLSRKEDRSKPLAHYTYKRSRPIMLPA